MGGREKGVHLYGEKWTGIPHLQSRNLSPKCYKEKQSVSLELYCTSMRHGTKDWEEEEKGCRGKAKRDWSAEAAETK